MSNFDPNAIIRGAQLTLVGAHRALQNPNLFKHDLYRQAALAVAAGIAIRMIVEIPVLIAKVILWIFSHVGNLDAATWDEAVIDSLRFLQHSVLQVPFFLMTLMKHITPALDNMFMEALQWVDTTYVQKHKSDNPETLRALYYPNLKLYTDRKAQHKGPWSGVVAFAIRYGRKAGISLSVYLLSCLPYVGKFVLPAASFYTFNRAVGSTPAIVIFASGLVLPKRYLVTFLQTYFSSRSMMRELLDPYFSRVPFTRQQKRAWLKDREGVLFGFGAGFFMMVKIPLVGVLVYGIAEASAAFLITKITDPPPPPSEAQQYAESQVRWKNKKEFLKLPLEKIDTDNEVTSKAGQEPRQTEMPSKQFT